MGQKIDNLDRNIINLLSENARLSNRKIAAQLGFTEGTIRERVKRLEKDNFIRFTAVTSMEHQPRTQLAYIGVYAEQKKIQAVASEIANIADIGAVIILLGRFDIMAIGLFDGLENFQKVVNQSILSIDGVRRIETSAASEIIKYDNKVAKIITPLEGFTLEYR